MYVQIVLKEKERERSVSGNSCLSKPKYDCRSRAKIFHHKKNVGYLKKTRVCLPVALPMIACSRAKRLLPSMTNATCCGMGPCLRAPMSSSRSCRTVQATGGDDAIHLDMPCLWREAIAGDKWWSCSEWTWGVFFWQCNGACG